MSLSSDHSPPRTARRLFGDTLKNGLKDKLKDKIKGRCAQPHCSKEGVFPAPRADQGRQEGRQKEQQGGRQARTWLCLEHARDANSAWNIFAGMSDAEVERAVRAAAVGERPTWPINAPFRGSEENAAQTEGAQKSAHAFWKNSLHDSLDDSLRRFRNIASARRISRDPPLDPPRDHLTAKTCEARGSSSPVSTRRHPRTRAEREACRVMSLTPPLCPQQLKARYRTLAKAHHPDQHLVQRKKQAEQQEMQTETQAEKQEQFKRINAAYALLQKLWQQSATHAPPSGRQK